MSGFIVGKYRQVTGYLKGRINPRNMKGLTTSGHIDDELWILLENYSEIKEEGLKYFKNNGIKNSNTRNKLFKHFQAYIRQAKNYYYSAKTLAPRSSGLLYYYCFLNLAKAAILIKDPSIAGKKISHGLSYKINSPSNFSKQKIKILNDGVFPKLYDWYFSKSIKEISLSIPELLNYCSDIGYQCELAGIDKPKTLYCKNIGATDKNKKTAWSLIAIPESASILKYKKSFNDFLKNFEKVDVPQLFCREMFDLDAFQQSSYAFFQSKDETKWISDNIPPMSEVRDNTLKSLNNCFQTYYFGNGADFTISLPYLPNKQIRMDETIAIYLVMFYLSNLVRYKPQYLEGLLSKKEAWLIDSFVKSCSVTFLRAIVSRIINIDFVLEIR